MNEKRLIDVNAADVNEIPCYYDEYCTTEDVQHWLNEQPTVDAVEVVHGRWEHIYDDTHYHAKCIACGRTAVRIPINYCGSNFKIKWDYCPNCGAKMDLEG